jgi:hypothetical protein
VTGRSSDRKSPVASFQKKRSSNESGHHWQLATGNW